MEKIDVNSFKRRIKKGWRSLIIEKTGLTAVEYNDIIIRRNGTPKNIFKLNKALNELELNEHPVNNFKTGNAYVKMPTVIKNYKLTTQPIK